MLILQISLSTMKILVIEEIEEYYYKIDRMMIQLRRAGKLKGLCGLVVGHMTNILDSQLSFGERIEEIMMDKVKDYDFPVAFNCPIGHENPNLAWYHGHVMTLEVAADESVLKPT